MVLCYCKLLPVLTAHSIAVVRRLYGMEVNQQAVQPGPIAVGPRRCAPCLRAVVFPHSGTQRHAPEVQPHRMEQGRSPGDPQRPFQVFLGNLGPAM